MKKILLTIATLVVAFCAYAQEEYYAVNYRFIEPEYSATFDGSNDCIRTGLEFTAQTKIEIKCQALSYESFDKIFSFTTSPYFGIGMNNTNKWYYLANGTTATFANIDFSNPQTILFDAVLGKVQIGDSVVNIGHNVQTGSEILIGSSNEYTQNANIEFYYCKIWQQGRLVRYYIPQVDGTIKDIMNDVTYQNYEKGTELITNGDFSSGFTGWTGSDWSEVDGAAKNAGGDDWLSQAGTLPTNNTEYEISFDINRTSTTGNIGAYRGIGAQTIEQNIANGSHFYQFQAGTLTWPTDNFLGFKTNTGWVGTVDNISVIPIGRTPFPVTRLDGGGSSVYVALTGDDVTGDGSLSTPWRTIQHAIDNTSQGVNIMILGGVYNEKLTFTNKIGIPGGRIALRAYDYDNPPIISGFYSVPSFDLTGGDKYSADIPSMTLENGAITDWNCIMYNDQFAIPARYPDSDYIRIQGADDTWHSFHSVPVTHTPSEHAWIDLKVDKYFFGRSQPDVTVSGNIVTADLLYNGAYNYKTFRGYFFANDSSSLNVDGEFYANLDTRRLTVKSTTVPDSVRKANLDVLVILEGAKYITFDGLVFEGANTWCVDNRRSDHTTFEDCEFRYASSGIAVRNLDDEDPLRSGSMVIRSCHFHDLLNMAIDGLDEMGSALVEQNTFEDIALYHGLGWPKNAQYSTVRINGDGLIFRDNIIRNVGYHGISFNGANSSVYHNYIKNACMTLDDGGGIYTGGANIAGREIYENIVERTYGNSDGTYRVDGVDTVTHYRAGHSYYLDESANDVYLHDNVAISSMNADSITDSALKFHKGRNHIISDNVWFYHNIGYSIEAYSADVVENITFLNNLTVVPPNGLAMFWISLVAENIDDLGTMSNEHVNHWFENGDSLFKTRKYAGNTIYQSQYAFDAQQGGDNINNFSSEYDSDTNFVVAFNPSNASDYITISDSLVDLVTLTAHDTSAQVEIPAWGVAVMLPDIPVSEEVLGPELISNGAFVGSLSPWTLSGTTNWTWNAGEYAEIDATAATGKLVQSNIFTEAETEYRVSFDFDKTSENGVVYVYRGDGVELIYTAQSPPAYSFSYTTPASVGGNTELIFNASTGFVGSIDNVSVKVVNPPTIIPPVDTNLYGAEKILNGNFVGLTNWSNIGTTSWTEVNEEATIDATAASGGLFQDNIFTDTADWKVEFDLTRIAGTLALYRGDGAEQLGSFNTSGHKTHTFSTPLGIETGTNDGIKFNANIGFIGYIDNVSVKEMNPPAATEPTDTNTYGAELLTNNTFDTDLSGWTDGGTTSWSWSTEGANIDATSATGYLQQNSIFEDSTDYRVTVNFNSTAGYLYLYRGIGTDQIGTEQNVPGTYSFDYPSDSVGADNSFVIWASQGFVGTVDSVSVQELNPPAEEPYSLYYIGLVTNGQFDVDIDEVNWTTSGTSTWTWNSSDSTVSVDATAGTGILYQDNLFSDNTTYRISYDLLENTGTGGLTMYRGDGIQTLITAQTQAGTYEETFSTTTVGTADNLRVNGGTNFIGKIDNISISEVPDTVGNPNLVPNGDFSNGFTDWYGSSTVLGLDTSNGYVEFTSTADGYIQFGNLAVDSGAVYYMSFDVYRYSGATNVHDQYGPDASTINSWNSYSPDKPKGWYRYEALVEAKDHYFRIRARNNNGHIKFDNFVYKKVN